MQINLENYKDNELDEILLNGDNEVEINITPCTLINEDLKDYLKWIKKVLNNYYDNEYTVIIPHKEDLYTKPPKKYRKFIKKYSSYCKFGGDV